jgi:RNA polymerase sigma-B factor
MSDAESRIVDSEDLVLRYLEAPRPDLKDLILIEYSAMVERVARRFAGIEPQEDLVQVGFIGLLNALSKFDPKAGVRFNTYATYLVAGEIKHYLRDRAQTIRHPAWLQELRHKVNRSMQLLSNQLGREPTEREVAEDLGVSESVVKDVWHTNETLRIASLDALPADEDGDTELDRLDAADFCPEQLGMEDRMVLESAMKQLRDLERQVLVLFHFEALNQTEIASRLGISCNYVSHILRQSLAKLRRILVDEEEKDRILKRQAASIDYDVLDPVTGAYTEAYFRARLQEELHRASSEESSLAFALVFVEGLDALRTFYGQQSVEDFLLDASEFLKGQVRRLDVVARYGASGFAVLLPATGANATLVRQRLQARLSQWLVSRFSAAGGLTVKIGFATFPDEGRTSSELIAAATEMAKGCAEEAGRSKAA